MKAHRRKKKTRKDKEVRRRGESEENGSTETTSLQLSSDTMQGAMRPDECAADKSTTMNWNQIQNPLKRVGDTCGSLRVMSGETGKKSEKEIVGRVGTINSLGGKGSITSEGLAYKAPRKRGAF